MYRAFLTATALSAASFSVDAADRMAPLTPDSIDLTELRWQARPIVIFSDADDPRLAEQLAKFETARIELEDRENVVIVDTVPGSRLRDRFGPEAFTVILIGKDGGEKLRRNRVVDPHTLNALIDTMPMRRQEILRSSD